MGDLFCANIQLLYCQLNWLANVHSNIFQELRKTAAMMRQSIRNHFNQFNLQSNFALLHGGFGLFKRKVTLYSFIFQVYILYG